MEKPARRASRRREPGLLLASWLAAMARRKARRKTVAHRASEIDDTDIAQRVRDVGEW